ncbi:class I SAM-dependent methyltransferase [Spirosoma sp. BT702]|uniref:Class I SAM-dependent methyltransferase n=1 Tax=Spirosoma profusum TaxID=2771354 RepID=A0A926Y052_9BACT|nr:class I SAM-dependent methyltransferase [Spirosoma profusum]MBD2703471.1 class I SAM-dependent methyltransferase [Spirosoma profusum]
MTPTRLSFLEKLAQFGQTSDQQATRREEKLLNITPETGPFLALLIKAMGATAILEIGTSNGYSTIWLADAAQNTGGHVTTIEQSAVKADQARENFGQAAVTDTITLLQSPAEAVLPTLSAEEFDFIFLDSNRNQYVGWWNLLFAILKPGGLMVVDNAVSHEAELADFTLLLNQSTSVETSLAPLGNGELLVWKQRSERPDLVVRYT